METAAGPAGGLCNWTGQVAMSRAGPYAAHTAGGRQHCVEAGGVGVEVEVEG